MGRKHNHQWSEDERDIIRRDYTHNKASVVELARKLTLMTGDTITTGAIKGQVDLLGLATPKGYWTPKEDEMLAELISKYCPSRIAKIMHRSINSVVRKAAKLKLSRKARDGWYSLRDVAYIFGASPHWVTNRIKTGQLTAKAHNPSYPPGKRGGSPWHISEQDLIDFISKHPQELQGRNVDMVVVVDLLLNRL